MKKIAQKNIALFDFDGTITKKDTLIEFIKFAAGTPSYYWGLLQLSPVLMAYVLKLLPNDVAKEKMLAVYFKGYDVEHFTTLARQYALKKIDTIVREEARMCIKQHQEQGDTICIVSASMKCWLEPWCKRENIALISTELEVCQGKITGRFSTKNCHGKEKEKRVLQKYDLSLYDTIYAYGDSAGDKALLALADKAYYRPFRG